MKCGTMGLLQINGKGVNRMERKKKINIIAGIVVALIVIAICTGVYKTQLHGPLIGEAKNKVAVIRVDGAITGGDPGDSLLASGEGVSSGQLMRQFRKARQDDSVKVVLLRLNSPGGSAAATQEIAVEMEKLRDSGKPIIVSMGDTAASAAYWMAAEGDEIYANPATITGSIGVYMGYYNAKELSQKLGITEEKIKSGIHKDIFSPFRDMTPEERQMTQTMVNDMYEQFVAVVAKGRHMDTDKVRQLADGRIYTGKQAQELGLVDKMGNYYDALEGAAKKAGITDMEHIPVVEYGQNNSFRQLLLGQMSLSQLIQGQLGLADSMPQPLMQAEGWKQQ